ncbi:glycosylphosphatidylinositol anchor attachment 1 protein-like isoform X2 [Littorina saxatilis]|uniref:GPI-anchor transamidase component GPAA1 n=1 Tax=Littorina saxatilis TaxID=31220 RepID=A0AAN9BZE6_9CAEN
MGLLTDTKQRQIVLRMILRYHQRLSILLYIVGLVWFLALAYRPLNAGTYFSENALLPGLVESDLPHGFPSLNTYTDLLKAEISKDKKRAPKEWIFKQLQSLGLDTYRHNFTIKYPFKMAISQDLNGENIFAILRARRGASTEALVMSVPLRSAAAQNQRTSTDGGIALMLALASQFRKNTFWAKDVIFLLSEFEEVGVQAWLDAYHESSSPYVIADDLPARSGAIQAAINLELPSENVRYLNLKLEGLNGQLPNLDLFNLAVKLSRRESVPATLQHRRDPHDQESWEGYQHTLRTMLKMMWTQASGAPSGNHGLFHRFHIEALTIEGVHKKKGVRNVPLEQVARVVEGVFRSLNNLLERFHQSFFFYILPSTDRYISIGLYMPPFALMVVAGVLKALALWIMTHSDVEDTTDEKAPQDETEEEKSASGEGEQGEEKETDDQGDGKDKPKGDTSPLLKRQSSGDKSKEDTPEEEIEEEGEGEQGDLPDHLTAEDLADLEDQDFEPIAMTGVLSVMPVVLMSYLLGLMAYTAPYVLTNFTPGLKMKTADVILYGILAVFSAGLAYPYLMNRKTAHEDRIVSDWRLVKCVGLIVQGLTLFAVSLMNISLAFFMAAVSVPVSMAVKPTRNIFLRTILQLALLIVSPMGVLFIAAVANTTMHNSSLGLLAVLWQAIDETKQLLFLLLVDQYLFYSWTYTLASFAFLPTWLLFWAVPFCDN